LAKIHPALADLTEEQIVATRMTNGTQGLFGYRGVGKSLVVARKAAWLTDAMEVHSERILIITRFSHQKEEMLRSLEGFPNADNVIVEQIEEVVRRLYAYAKKEGDFQLTSSQEARRMAWELVLQVKPEEQKIAEQMEGVWRGHLERCYQKKAPELTETADVLLERGKAIARIEEQMHRSGKIDYPLALFELVEKEGPGFRLEVKDQFAFVMVDGFVEPSPAEIELVGRLTDEENNLLVCWDTGERGILDYIEGGGIEVFKKMTGGKISYLNKVFLAPEKIGRAALAVRKGREDILFAKRGGVVAIADYEGRREEATRITEEINYLNRSERIPLDRIAVVCPGEDVACYIAESLKEYGVPFEGTEDLSKSNFGELIFLWMKAAHMPYTSDEVERLLKTYWKEIDGRKLDEAKRLAGQSGGDRANLWKVLREQSKFDQVGFTGEERKALERFMNMQSRMADKTKDHVHMVVQAIERLGLLGRNSEEGREAREYASFATCIIKELPRRKKEVSDAIVALQARDVPTSTRGVKVRIATQFIDYDVDYVILPGMEDEGVPSAHEQLNKGERRGATQKALSYRALMQARKGAYLTWCKRTCINGKEEERSPSPIFSEIPEDVIAKTQ